MGLPALPAVRRAAALAEAPAGRHPATAAARIQAATAAARIQAAGDEEEQAAAGRIQAGKT